MVQMNWSLQTDASGKPALQATWTTSVPADISHEDSHLLAS